MPQSVRHVFEELPFILGKVKHAARSPISRASGLSMPWRLWLPLEMHGNFRMAASLQHGVDWFHANTRAVESKRCSALANGATRTLLIHSARVVIKAAERKVNRPGNRGGANISVNGAMKKKSSRYSP